VVDRLRALPPILLEDARPALERCAEILADAGDEDAFERMKVLRGMCREVKQLRAVSA
jgi:hypothetical protein